MDKRISYALFVFIIVFSNCCSSPKVIEPTLTQQPTKTPIPTATTTPTLTPTPLGGSSGNILYTSEKSDVNAGDNIFISDISNLESKQLTNNIEKELTFSFPIPSHNGKKIAYVVDKNIGETYYGEPFWKSEINIMDINGENQEKISSIQMYKGNTRIENLLIETSPSWSPDDKRLAFSSNRNLLIEKGIPNDMEIYTINLETFEIKQLTKATGESIHPSWSPDGSQITFCSNRDGDWDIFIMNSDGTGNDLKITNNSTTDRYPSWSYDGKKIIYHSDRDGNFNLYYYDIDNKAEIKLTNYPTGEYTARWSPDDNWIVFSSDKDGDDEIFLLNLTTKEEIKITDNQVIDGYQNWIP